MDEKSLNEEEAAPEAEPKPELELQVATDKMAAYLRIKAAPNGNREVSYEEIMEFLRQAGVCYGVFDGAIREYCDKKQFFLELKCAEGLPPVDEENGKIVYNFRTEQSNAPQQKEDGTVDYMNLGLVQNVSAGDLLCQLTLPAPGQDGIDIYNDPVPYTRGKIPKFPSGKNTVISEDGLTLTAAIDGCIEYKNAMLNIDDAFVVHGDVGSSSGNITFTGTVTVQGDVREGFTVKAGRDIIIRGFVEGATIEAGGNVTIAKGMNGMGKGVIRAEGDISGKYFENVSLFCKGDVYADVVMNSRTQAEGSVFLKGRNALLIGGSCQVGRRVYAGTIGNENNSHTEICIASQELQKLLSDLAGGETEKLRAALTSAKEKEAIYKTKITALTREIAGKQGVDAIKAELRSAILKKGKIEAEVRELEAKIAASEKDKQSSSDFNIIGVKTIFAGTKLKIGSFVQILSENYNNIKFYSDRGSIVNGPVLPSDRIG
jgi:uncharacterized protein (DUF342 family)